MSNSSVEEDGVRGVRASTKKVKGVQHFGVVCIVIKNVKGRLGGKDGGVCGKVWGKDKMLRRTGQGEWKKFKLRAMLRS